MSRRRAFFEENHLQNFQVQAEFDKLMQIEGLSGSHEDHRNPFPSVKGIFTGGKVNVVGGGVNANIRAFTYLLLCHIRREHLSKLLNDLRQSEHRQQQQNVGKRDRRVSFNKGTLFLNGPQYENYTLHKLRIFAFSSSTDFSIIEDHPLSKFHFKGKHLSSEMMKKLLSEFLKKLLPETLSSSYKDSLRSVRYYLNLFPVAEVILTLLMRYILLSKYEVSSALSYKQQVNSHTVCTTLCDAFAIDGLICKDQLFEISSWCKMFALSTQPHAVFLVEIRNNEFEQLGTQNDIKPLSLKRLPTFGKNNQAQSVEMSKQIVQEQSKSSSVMSADQDSQIASSKSSSKVLSSQQLKKPKGLLLGSEECSSIQLKESSFDSHNFRDTFSKNNANLDSALNQIRQQSPQKEQKYSQEEGVPPASKIDTQIKQLNTYPSDCNREDSSDCEAQLPKADGLRPIINNNIHNNIYFNIPEAHSYPLINISTVNSKPSQKSLININLT